MDGKLSNEDRERIKRFLEKPRYQRTPDLLCPGEDEQSD